MEEEDNYDPYLVSFDKIKIEENLMYQNNILQEDVNMVNENENNLNEDIEMKNENNLRSTEQNPINNFENNNLNNGILQNINDTNKVNEQYNKMSDNNKINISIPSKMSNEEIKISQEYDYGYSILFINEGENGFIEDFIKERTYESTTQDCFNFHLDEEKWIKFLNHSIFVQYDKNYKEYMEKQQKIRLLQNMYKQNANMNVAYQATNPGFPHMFNYPQQLNMPNIPMYPVK